MANFVNYLDSLSDEQKALLPGDLLMDNNFQPTNRNKLTTNRFLFNMTRTPYLAYFCQRVNIPSLGFGTSIQSNPTAIEIKRPGTRLIYEDLQIGFIVDEEMKNWLEIHNWLKKISTYDTVYDYLKEEQKTASALLYVMSAAYKPLLSIYFHDIYPTFLSSIDFDSTSPDSENIISTVTFSYTYYEIKQGEA
jgi:hypothetical protein